jgi:hypothetical protein
MKLPNYRKNEVTREDRAFNIAVFMLHQWSTWVANGFDRVGIATVIRDGVRKAIALPTLPHRKEVNHQDIKARQGDDRANGDAIGGHCLQLSMVKVFQPGQRPQKAALINAGNKRKLEDFLHYQLTDRVKTAPSGVTRIGTALV